MYPNPSPGSNLSIPIPNHPHALLPPKKLDSNSAKFPHSVFSTHFFWHTFLTQSFQYVTICRTNSRKARKLLSMHWTNLKSRIKWNLEMIKKAEKVLFFQTVGLVYFWKDKFTTLFFGHFKTRFKLGQKVKSWSKERVQLALNGF